MARFAANLTFLFTELPMERRFEAARAAGFEGVEILFPYDFTAGELRRGCQSAGLEFLLLNTPPPNWAGGPRGFAAEPGNESRFRGDFDRALRFGRALGVKHLHVMAGKAQGGLARRTFVENLKWACARDARTSLTIEPMNRNDMPGYFLDSFELAAEILDEVGAPNLGLQFDVYHAQMIHRDALTVWQRHAPRVRHIQISDWPSRHEPRQGDIDFAELFHAIDAAGYRGWVSAEYTPRSSTEAGLRWLRLA